FSHLWSLAVEEHFYIIMPLLFSYTIRRWKVFLIGMLTLCAAISLYRWIALDLVIPHVPPNGSSYNGRATEARLDSILYGCIAAVCCRYIPAVRTLLRRFGTLLLIFAALLMIASIAPRSEFFEEVL